MTKNDLGKADWTSILKEKFLFTADELSRIEHTKGFSSPFRQKEITQIGLSPAVTKTSNFEKSHPESKEESRDRWPIRGIDATCAWRTINRLRT